LGAGRQPCNGNDFHDYKYKLATTNQGDCLLQVKPDGRVLLLEHARSDNPLLGWYQGVTSKSVAATGKGCVWDQDLPALIREAGLEPVRQEEALSGLIRLIEARRLS